MSKASADESKIAESPSAAARTWQKLPISEPRTVTRPALRPCSTLRVMIYKTTGPGVRSRSSAAGIKEMRLTVDSAVLTKMLPLKYLEILNDRHTIEGREATRIPQPALYRVVTNIAVSAECLNAAVR